MFGSMSMGMKHFCPATILKWLQSITSAVGSRNTDGKYFLQVSVQLSRLSFLLHLSALIHEDETQ